MTPDSHGFSTGAVITLGTEVPLANIAAHENGPLTRWLMMSVLLDPSAPWHIALHEFNNVTPDHRSYCAPHYHRVHEMNLFFPTEGKSLVVDLQIDSEFSQLVAPAAVFIPAGSLHAANVFSGSGILIAMVMEKAYEAFQ